MYAEG
ncbi:hypothetical protein D030_2550A, partial [Vibrio parahaemolyticus AQ3810]